MASRLKAVLKAAFTNPNKAKTAAAIKAHTKKRALDDFFEQVERLETFREGQREKMRAEERDKDEAVEQALAGFQESQQEDRMLEKGFHPDSTPTERMTQTAISLILPHIAPILSKKWSKNNSSSSPRGASLEQLAGTHTTAMPLMVTTREGMPQVATREIEFPPDPITGLPPPPPPEEPCRPCGQTTESGAPADQERIVLFLEQLGLNRQQLAMFGIYPERINPARMTPDWMLGMAEHVKALQE